MAVERPTIAVINDDVVQLRLIERVLQGAGYHVLAYPDSSDALTRLENRPTVDLFLVDLHMPGIDGWKVCRLLRSPHFGPYNEVPILIVSATFTGSDVEAITADIGADAFLPMPFSRSELLEDISDLLAGKRPRSRSTALVIEDDDGVAHAVTRTFENHGYDVHRARTIEEGNELWTSINPDLVLLDFHLPDGTGPALLSQLQSPSDRTVVLVMTGDTDPDLPVRLLQLGADGYVRKPFDPAFLLELAGKARRERSLLRVEALLERRTQELTRSDARFRSLFHAIPDLVLTLDDVDRILATNQGASSALGVSSSELVGQHISRFVREDQMPLVSAALRRIRGTGGTRYDTILVAADGRQISVEVTGAAPDGGASGSVLMVARDLTERHKADEERRRLDAQVQHAQRLESLGVLAGGIAHDFNNLLVGVMGNASLALLDTPEGSSVHECISQIETASRRAAELTQQILTFSGKGDSVMSLQDASSVVSEMGQLLAPAVSKKAELTYRLRRDLPPVHADPSQLRQVVMNLIMNASDALSEQEGRITVRTEVVDLDEAAVRRHYLGESAAPGKYVAIEVADNGCGMDEETRRQIFDPFFTTKFAGRGLGLAATLGIVRAHAGLLLVTSKPGEGTKFRVLLPASERTAHRDPSPPSPPPGLRGSGGSVLVVDDEPAVRTLASTALARAGFSVLEASDGQRGLDLLASDHDVDLVLLDLTMPTLGGMEVLREIRERLPGLPVLLSSGYSDTSVPEGTFAPGVTAFLRKPYSPVELVEGISALMHDAHRRENGVPTVHSIAKVMRASG